MKKQLSGIFSTKTVCLSLASILTLGFGMPFCKKEAPVADLPAIDQVREVSVDSKNASESNPVEKAQELAAEALEASSSDKSEVVLLFSDQSKLTRAQVESVATEMLAQSPYGNIKLSDLPAQIYSQLTEQVVNAKVVAHWAKKTGIYDRPDFKQDVAKLIEMIKEMKAQEYFAKEIKGTSSKPSDKEVDNYYNQNLKNFLKSAGGVTTAMVSFDSKDLAQEFLNALATDGKENTVDAMKSLQAELKSGEYKSFGKITKDMLDGTQKPSMYGFPRTTAPEGVLKFVKGAKKYPSTGIVDLGEEKFAVVLCADSSDDVYYGLPEVKGHITQLLEQESAQKSYKEALDKITKKYISKDHRSVLAQAVKPKGGKGGQPSQEEMLAQLMSGMQGDGGMDSQVNPEELQEALKSLEGMSGDDLKALEQSFASEGK